MVTATAGDGNAGELTIHANDSVEVSSGSRITSQTNGSGNGGNLTVETRRLITRNGDISPLQALESIELVGTSVDGIRPSGISAFSRPPDNVDNPSLWQGNANSGGVTLSTQKLMIQEGAEVTTAVEGRSQSGNAGDIQVQANSVSLSDRGRIISRNQGQGVAGDINLTLQNTLQTNGGEISASSDQSGGGDITD